MAHEPILYDTPHFEHASVAVSFCQEVLREQGLTLEAGQLEGLDVSCPALARVALKVLGGFRVMGPAAEYVTIAQHLCERALGLQKLRAAS